MCIHVSHRHDHERKRVTCTCSFFKMAPVDIYLATNDQHIGPRDVCTPTGLPMRRMCEMDMLIEHMYPASNFKEYIRPTHMPVGQSYSNGNSQRRCTRPMATTMCSMHPHVSPGHAHWINASFGRTVRLMYATNMCMGHMHAMVVSMGYMFLWTSPWATRTPTDILGTFKPWARPWDQCALCTCQWGYFYSMDMSMGYMFPRGYALGLHVPHEYVHGVHLSHGRVHGTHPMDMSTIYMRPIDTSR